jgi:hypothetical protein
MRHQPSPGVDLITQVGCMIRFHVYVRIRQTHNLLHIQRGQNLTGTRRACRLYGHEQVCSKLNVKRTCTQILAHTCFLTAFLLRWRHAHKKVYSVWIPNGFCQLVQLQPISCLKLPVNHTGCQQFASVVALHCMGCPCDAGSTDLH